MEKRICYFVIGSEGSGTYMMAESFVSVGVTYCHHDRLKDNFTTGTPEKIVLRRSLPHRGEWVNIPAMIGSLERDYVVVPIFMIRTPNFAVLSVYNRNKKRKIDHLRNNFLQALAQMSAIMTFEPECYLVLYEYFVSSPEYREWLFCKQLGLKNPEKDFYDGNAKYYSE